MLDPSSSLPRLPPTILHGLTTRLERQPESPALSFLGENGLLEDEVSYQALCSRATVVANWLTDRHASGERALLLFPAGIEFSVAFIGCLAAGCIAVPIPSPEPARLKRALPRLLTIAEDCKPAFVLTTPSILALREQICAGSVALSLAEWTAIESATPAPQRWSHCRHR